MLGKLHGTFKASFIVFVIVFGFVPVHGWIQDENAHVAAVSVNPSKLVVFTNVTFTVNISISDVSDMAGWEFILLWNRTVINCTKAVLHPPSEWADGTLDYGPGIMNDYDKNWWCRGRLWLQRETGYNSTFHGFYYKGQTFHYPESTFNGSMTIVTLTFQALQSGKTSLSLKNTVLGNSFVSEIPHTDCDGFVDIFDAVAFANCIGLQRGDREWNADFDINGNGKIDILDAIMIADGSGTSCP